MKVAIVFNAQSPLPTSRLATVGQHLSNLFDGADLMVCRGWGDAYVPKAHILDVDSSRPYRAVIAAITDVLLATGPSVLVSVGGDGLASYLATNLHEKPEAPTLLGIAAGTANVGPIVTFTVEQLADLRLSMMEPVPIDAISVSDESGFLGLGFNDVILGNTFLGTVEGVCCNLSVEELLLRDRRVAIEVGQDITTPDFSVTVNEKLKRFNSAAPIAQIVISPLQFDHLYGRAILGGLCHAAERPPLGAVGLISRNVVDCDPSAWEYDGFTTTEHLLLHETSSVRFDGLGSDAHVVIDGNPYLRRGAVTCSLVAKAVRAMKLKQGGVQ